MGRGEESANEGESGRGLCRDDSSKRVSVLMHFSDGVSSSAVNLKLLTSSTPSHEVDF